MLMCNRCMKLKEEHEIAKRVDVHGYTTFGQIEEVYSDYECECGGEYKPAKQCAVCKDWFVDTKHTGVCRSCLNDEMDFETCVDYGEDRKELSYINSFVSYLLTDDKINEILVNYIKDHKSEFPQKDIVGFCNTDLIDFSDWVKEKRD